jgi:hypothetical protein
MVRAFIRASWGGSREEDRQHHNHLPSELPLGFRSSSPTTMIASSSM